MMRRWVNTMPGVLVLAGATVLAGLAACLFFSPGETAFAERTAAEWAADLNRDPVPAKAALRAGGAAAVPVLTELLERGTSMTASHAAEVLYQVALEAPDALPPLVAMYKHSSVAVRYWALRALERIRPPDEATVCYLTELLKDAVPSIRMRAARVLGELGAPARSALPELVSALDDPNELVGIAAAGAVISLDPKHTNAFRYLVRRLGAETASDFRGEAIRTLQRLGPAAAGAATELNDLLGDADPDIREAADHILKQLPKKPVPQRTAAIPGKQLPRP